MEQHNNELEHEPKSNNGLSLLALLVALGSFGGSIYLHQHQHKQFQNQQQSQQKRFDELKNHVADLPEQISQTQKRQEALLQDLPGELQKSVEKQLNQGLQNSESALRAEMEQALLDYARGEVPRVDLSQEIARMDEIRAANLAALQEQQKLMDGFGAQVQQLSQHIHQQEQQFNQNFAQLLTQADAHLQAELSKLDQDIQQRIDPTPVLQLLLWADLSAQNGRFGAAWHYARQAEQAAAPFSQQDELKQALSALSQRYAQLAQYKPEQALQNIIAQAPSWSFKTQEQRVPAAEEQGWWASVKRFAAKSSSIQVIKSDDRALTWINKHEQLQAIVRENIALDLAFARNAVQLNDWESYQLIAKRLQDQISRYFQADAAVNEALQVLQQLQAPSTPDVQALKQQLEQLHSEGSRP